MSPHRHATLLLTAALTLAPAASAWQVTTIPTDLQMPGTQAGELTFDLDPATGCTTCHGNITVGTLPGRNWKGSMMAHSSRDPLFWAAMAVAEQDVPGSGDLCLRCHAPTGWLEDRSTPTDGSALVAPEDAWGVSCDVCHRVTNPDASEWFPWQFPPFEAHDGGAPAEGYVGSGQMAMFNDLLTKLGPYDDASPPNHVALGSDYHRSSEMCGTCHDVSNPLVGDLAPGNGAFDALPPGSYSGVPGGPVTGKAAFNNPPHAYGVVERTFSEHASSALATLPVANYAGLPGELRGGSIETAYQAAHDSNAPTGNYLDGTLRTFTCQTCHMPPVGGKGCELAAAPVRDDNPLHDLTGGNTWAPQAIAWLDGEGLLTFGGGLTTAELDDLAAGADRALGMLTDAAGLDVYGDTARITNRTGHKLISGYPDGRRMWLRVTWKDSVGNVLRIDGEYGPVPAYIDGVLGTVDSIVDLDDPHLAIFEAHHGISGAWAGQLIAMGTSPWLPVDFDRTTGDVDWTLGDVAGLPPSAVVESFHFALNDRVISDNRIPPYGMRHDDALERNCLPVPAAQYGSPGPGGVFNHWAEVLLDPPVGAQSGDVELLYQTTSWEYVRFLYEANDGTIDHLANEDLFLLRAWLATEMAPPVVMATDTWLPWISTPWGILHVALAGPQGIAELTGSGPCVPGESVNVKIERASPNVPTWIVLGLGLLQAPFKGGTLVPTPDVVLDGLKTSPQGSLSFLFPWPDVAPGVSVHMQAWFAEAQGTPHGFSSTDGLSATTQ